MAQFQITLDSEIVQGIFQRDDGLSTVVEQVLNQILKAQVGEQLQAERYERTEKRQGYREREMVTRVGAITLDVPLVRNGTFSTELFARYQRSEQALILALMEMVVNGVSTRKVRRVTEDLCGTSFSKSTVSELCRGLDGAVTEWNERRLDEQGFPFVIVDALVLKVRKNGHIRSQSALLAIGVNDEGYREILGLRLGDSESRDRWSEFFTWLKSRGLHGVDLVTSDDHAGLVQAIGLHFQNGTWQRCQTHYAERRIMPRWMVHGAARPSSGCSDSA